MKLRLAKKIYKDAVIKNNAHIAAVDNFLFSDEWQNIIFHTLHTDEEVDNYLDNRFPMNYRYNSFMFNRADVRISQWHRRDKDHLHLFLTCNPIHETKMNNRKQSDTQHVIDAIDELCSIQDENGNPMLSKKFLVEKYLNSSNNGK